MWSEGDQHDGGFALRHDGALDLVVHPGSRGRGVGAALAAQALADGGAVTAWSHGNHPAAARLAATHDLERVRDLWVMRRAGADPLPALDPPAGVRVRHWRSDGQDADTEAAALLAVNAEAFADHPEQGAMDRDGPGRPDGRGLVRPGRPAARRGHRHR